MTALGVDYRRFAQFQIGRPATEALLRAHSHEWIASREGGDRGDDDGHHAHRIPSADSCSIRSGVSVAALLR